MAGTDAVDVGSVIVVGDRSTPGVIEVTAVGVAVSKGTLDGLTTVDVVAIGVDDVFSALSSRPSPHPAITIVTNTLMTVILSVARSRFHSLYMLIIRLDS